MFAEIIKYTLDRGYLANKLKIVQCRVYNHPFMIRLIALL
jgi:hypothetical protein